MSKVSVIIPVYNAEKYLRECLESVISQTLTDIEIICINDGSTDSSMEILQEYALKDKRFQILEQGNKGAGAARNLGINSATGEFVAFMDSDDKYPDLETLEFVYNMAKKHNVLIAGGEFSFFTTEDATLTQEFSEADKKYSFEKNEIIQYKDYQFDYGYTRFIYNREFLLKNNLFFPDYRRFQDPPFMVKTMFYAREFLSLHRITYSHRIFHQEVCWNSLRIRHLLSGLLDNYKFANENNLEELKNTTTERLLEHIGRIKENLEFREFVFLSSFAKYDEKIKKCYIDEKLTFIKRYISPLLRCVFSLRNSEDKCYKIITVFGIKLKLKRKAG